jgi:membrane associated rhomboid family serine protease
MGWNIVDEIAAIVRFAQAFLPLGILHFALPTLSYFEGEQPLLEFLSDFYRSNTEICNRDVLYSLTLDNFDRKRNGTQLLSHIFVHVNNAHLYNNLIGAFQFGYEPFLEYGAEGFYSIFLLGGIFAALPLRLFSEGKEVAAKRWESLLKDKSDSVTPSLLSGFQSSIAKISGKFLADALAPTRGCGSSGAVCALAGSSLVIHTKKLVSAVQCEYQDYKKDRENQSYVNKPKKHQQVWLSMNRFITNNGWELMRVAKLVTYLSVEFMTQTSVDTSTSRDQSFASRFIDIMNKSQLGTEVHLQGAVFGIAYTIFFGVAVPTYTRSRKGI